MNIEIMQQTIKKTGKIIWKKSIENVIQNQNAQQNLKAVQSS